MNAAALRLEIIEELRSTRMSAQERGARERNRRRASGEMTQAQRSKGSAIVHRIGKYNWRSRAVRHLTARWSVPPTDRDLFHCGKREA
jgi:hypothetical protein